MKGCLTVVEAKLLQPISETFCSIPTDNANCCYLNHLTSGASKAQCQPTKFDDGGSAASPMIKSAKIRRE